MLGVIHANRSVWSGDDYRVKFGVITAVSMKSVVLWGVTMCIWQIFTDVLEACCVSIFRIDYEGGISAISRNGLEHLPRGMAMYE
jgi:hypothetical protein